MRYKLCFINALSSYITSYYSVLTTLILGLFKSALNSCVPLCSGKLMYNIQNMHPIWLHLVYRTQWQLGVINHVCLNYPA